MKILRINNFYYQRGGSEAVYFNTVDHLKKNGHVIFFSSNIMEISDGLLQRTEGEKSDTLKSIDWAEHKNKNKFIIK